MTEKTYTFTRRQLNVEKNNVIAKFATLASHDLKNSIGGLSNIAYYLSKSLKVEDESQKKMIDLLSKEVNNLNKKIAEVFDTNRIKQLTKTKCDLKNIILLAISETQIEGIIFEHNLISVPVYADSERLKQAITNIITNAKEAMKNYGTIKIDTQLISDTAIVTIKDFGSGMTPDVLEQCFDPLFSTKITKAVGMGLTIAQQIIEMHNGTVKIESSAARGTTVIISLPINKK